MTKVGKLSRRRTTSVVARACRRDARRRSQRGAAGVEAAFICAFFLIPMFMGVLTYGQRFWDEQQQSLDPARLPQSIASGYCTTQQIADRVKSAAADAIYALNKDTLASYGINDPAGVLSRLQTRVTSLGAVGADVDVSLTLPDRRLGYLPVSGAGPLVYDLNQRLNYVSVSTNGTQCSP